MPFENMFGHAAFYAARIVSSAEKCVAGAHEILSIQDAELASMVVNSARASLKKAIAPASGGPLLRKFAIMPPRHPIGDPEQQYATMNDREQYALSALVTNALVTWLVVRRIDGFVQLARENAFKPFLAGQRSFEALTQVACAMVGSFDPDLELNSYIKLADAALNQAHRTKAA